jgi:hypothetical protein
MFARPFRALILVAIVAAVAATQVRAECLSMIASYGVREFKRRNCWPKPFNYPDRQAARAPFYTMVSNGWERQNMLGDHHFIRGTGELTEAGKLKVRWILTAAPPHHRDVYVHRAITADETAARMHSVRFAAAEIVPERGLPGILETDIPEYGWPAWRVDAIGRAFESSMPEPRLPEIQGAEGD